MDAQTKNCMNLKGIIRISMSVVVTIIAAKIVFIIFWSFTFFPVISDSSILGATIFAIGTIVGISAGTLIESKLN
jgi:hypothetical protein